MTTVIRELDRRGFSVNVNGNRTYVNVNGTDVEIRLQEPYQKTYGPPPDWELRWAEMDGRDPKPSYELVPTGKLELTILEYAEGLRKTFRDTRRGRLEEKLNDFMVALVAVAEALKERERIHAEWRRQQEEAALRRAEERMQAERQAQLVDQFRAAARQWDEANRLGAYLAAFQEVMGPEPCDETVQWLAWAEDYAARAASEALLPSGLKAGR
jgi:hypothetical protein